MPESGGEPVLTMARYQVERYLLVPEGDDKETSWVGLLRSNMLKRFESSAHAFRVAMGDGYGCDRRSGRSGD